MASIMLLPSKQGSIVLFAQDILAVTEGRGGTTDLYTNIFPQGITVDLPMEDFMVQWLSTLNDEEVDDEELAVMFEPDRTPEIH